MIETDFLVIGSGISGLNFSLNASKKGKVLIVTKKKIIDSNTNYAQGGIAAVLDKTDNFEQHIKDTMEAGSNHNNRAAVEFMVKKSTSAVHKLIELGVEFEKEGDKLLLTKEGGHRNRRIAYVGDYTGKEIESTLVKKIKENKNIKVLEDTFAYELIVKNKNCLGAKIIHKNKTENVYAKQTILATGGIGQILLNTTNPEIAAGDGLAMAIKAGCKTEDLEFIQFHPTALDKDENPKFLISEAVRGEGAKIVDEKNNEIMKGKHPMNDLAPRDIVAREIYQQSLNKKIYLDVSHESSKHLKNRFPKIFQKLADLGIDMSKDLIPITPAAHYICGGVKTDIKGQTNIKNLFAFGEVSHTGVHGANRLASNSLLEALVFSNEIVGILDNSADEKFTKEINQDKVTFNEKTEKKVLKLQKAIKETMWKYAGIVRNTQKIESEGLPKIKEIIVELDKIKELNQTIAETKNMALVGKKILESAFKRKKSIGCHYLK